MNKDDIKEKNWRREILIENYFSKENPSLSKDLINYIFDICWEHSKDFDSNDILIDEFIRIYNLGKEN